MTATQVRLLCELGRAVASLPPGGRVSLLSAVFEVEEEAKREYERAEPRPWKRLGLQQKEKTK
jgi:hypothetical protein